MTTTEIIALLTLLGVFTIGGIQIGKWIGEKK